MEGVKFEEGEIPNSNFHFPNLKKLHLKGSAGFIELFSNFTYPKVEDVKVDGWGDREDRGFWKIILKLSGDNSQYPTLTARIWTQRMMSKREI